MRKLIDIIGDSKILAQQGDINVAIRKLRIDSRKVQSGDVYIALKGFTSDGHQYIDQAIKKGAKAIVCEELPSKLVEDVVYLQVEETRKVLGELARRFYRDPSSALTLIGVTGTNGKTTVATLLYQLLTGLGYKTGLISTVENRIGSNVISATHTTPDVVSLNKILRKMVKAGCDFAFMEVSSHAVDQQRISGVNFDGAVFTNMSHDHLDYHVTFDNYIAAKKLFFDKLPSEAFAFVNVDDKRGEVMIQNTKARTLGYGLRKMTDYKAKIVSNSIHGLSLDIDGVEAHFRTVGLFNAYNLLSAYGVARELGFGREEILQVLTDIKGAEGRFEIVTTQKSEKTGIVDYAHTPDALQNVLETINAVKSAESKVITVVGCGGDRDKSKRPVMAKVAKRLSSKVILTSDNPRTEDAEDILDQMESGLENRDSFSVLRLENRKDAIEKAVKLAGGKDIILIAGKGHEKYQDIDGVKHPFDDKEVLRAAMLVST